MPAELLNILLIVGFFVLVVPAVCLAVAIAKGKARTLIVATGLIATAFAAFRLGHFDGYDHSAVALHWYYIQPFSRFCARAVELNAEGKNAELSNSLVRVRTALDSSVDHWRRPVWEQTNVFEVIEKEMK